MTQSRAREAPRPAAGSRRLHFARSPGIAACGSLATFASTTDDPAAVDCQVCRRRLDHEARVPTWRGDSWMGRRIADERRARAHAPPAAAIVLVVFAACLAAPRVSDAGRQREPSHRVVYLAASCPGAAVILETGDDPPEEHRIEDEPRVVLRVEAADLPTCRLVRTEDVAKLTARCSNDTRRVAAVESETSIGAACGVEEVRE